MADLSELGSQIAASLPPGAVTEAYVARGVELVIRIRRDQVRTVMAILRADPRFAFEQMMDLCGVDFPERPERFEVVWNLLSLTHNHRIRVVTTTDAETPVASVTAIWPVAGWWEREAWDMYGIAFEGNEDLRRILTDYGFQGHPLRKDFPLTGHVEVRYDEERREVIYEPVNLPQDFRNFDFLSPWEAMTTLPGDEKVHLNRIAPPPASLLEGQKALPDAEKQP
ncbi:NADH-quinone oxidoreductase subunit C [Roseomonas populi]|uniref:NADH-quinone oxidoreductase subunit C n=1 Tax=Roseomonas populi TaxID=3121582 RepID=A0ABT1X4H6_9PROT|nr:NADH-quinone oxidoreductase subunit C [Roseomonas pecuniae]MCR0982067.1 NADH-quinone oxidoreductase subunit C [Roseomonas pecuniae]